ncbi:hypothetical protein [Achromobacter denitrificans]|uniref:hypothetical protein n=1 Tax=Achromobacter denitrificans TaxID=32002 RepID=UPI0012FB34B9|nr:hypothetical protein [Achromobacter denitrificans]
MSIFLEAEMKSGGVFILGRPGDEKMPPRCARCAGSLPPKGAFSSWGGPAMKKEKGASGALVVVLGREQQCFPGFPAMDVTNHGARDCGRDDEAW